MQAMVIYSSQTGNTQKIATAIFAAIPGESKDMQRIEEYTGKDAEIFFVGFWTDRGNCDAQIANLLAGLHGKRIALFGTCGAQRDEAYYEQIIREVKAWIPPDNEYAGAFMCQGKMLMQVRKRYEAMLTDGSNDPHILRMIRNFDEALLHPDRKDEQEAAAFALEVMRA